MKFIPEKYIVNMKEWIPLGRGEQYNSVERAAIEIGADRGEYGTINSRYRIVMYFD